MTTTAIEFCEGLCKSADHYTIYPYSYNHDDSYTDNYYVKCSYDNKQDIYYFVGRNYNSRYTWRQISEGEYLAPLPVSFTIQIPGQISLALLSPVRSHVRR